MSEAYKQDIELAKRVQGGDPEADKFLYSQFDGHIRKRVEYRVFDAENREDVINEIWEGIFKSLRDGKYEGSSKLKTYVLGIAKNQILVYISKKSRIPKRTENLDNIEEIADTGRNIQEVMEEKERYKQLREIVKHMQPKLREIIFLRYFYKDQELMPYDEIAQMLNVPLSTVKNRLHTAYKKLAGKYKSGEQRFFQAIYVFTVFQKLCIRNGTH